MKRYQPSFLCKGKKWFNRVIGFWLNKMNLLIIQEGIGLRLSMNKIPVQRTQDSISIYHFVWRRRMSPCTGSRVDANYEQTASLVRAWFRIHVLGMADIIRHPPRWPACSPFGITHWPPTASRSKQDDLPLGYMHYFHESCYITHCVVTILGLILGLRSANERRRCKVTPSLIGWAHKQNDPCIPYLMSDMKQLWNKFTKLLTPKIITIICDQGLNNTQCNQWGISIKRFRLISKWGFVL